MDWEQFYNMLFAAQLVHIIHFTEDDLACIRAAFEAYDAVYISGTNDFSKVADVVNKYNENKNFVDFGNG